MNIAVYGRWGCGGTGRRARLKIWFLREWEFDSPRPYQKGKVLVNKGFASIFYF